MAVKADQLRRLADPFGPDELEWRAARSGKSGSGHWVHVLPYQTSRGVMDRFDQVCGPENWTNEFRAGPGGGVICRISVNVEQVGWTSKEDGAGNTEIEAVKGGLSGAMKRAAVQWGCGRYLYGIEESFGLVHELGRYSSGKGADRFRWNPPLLPEWALPREEPTLPELVAFIRTNVRRVEVRLRLGDRWRKLSEVVATHGELLQKDYYLARTLGQALAKANGISIRPTPAGPEVRQAA